VITASGLGAAIHGGLPILRTGWIARTLVLFTISGVVFAWRVAPLQRRLRALALHWEFWGAVALLAPVAGLALMVLKPGS
jgi:hypothetical protein